MNDEPTVSTGASVEANQPAKPWVEPKLVKLEAGEAQHSGNMFYDGISGNS